MNCKYKNKMTLIVLLMIFIVTIINAGYFYYNALKWYDLKLPISGYSFWFYMRFYGIGSILMFLSSFFILLGAVFGFFQEIQTGFFQNLVLRVKYRKYVIKSIVNSWVKSFFIFPLFSLILFFVSVMIFGHSINVPNELAAEPMVKFPDYGLSNPFLYVMLVTFLVWLYSIFIVNIGIIVSRYVNKFYLVLIYTFIIINAYNYVLSILSRNILYPLIKNDSLYQFNLFAAYQPFELYRLLPPYIMIICSIIITLPILYFAYNKKEELVLNND